MAKVTITLEDRDDEVHIHFTSNPEMDFSDECQVPLRTQAQNAAVIALQALDDAFDFSECEVSPEPPEQRSVRRKHLQLVTGYEHAIINPKKEPSE